MTQNESCVNPWLPQFSKIPGSKKQKVEGPFYPLQRHELLWLHKERLMNITALVYCALKLEHPHCDHPIEIDVKQFALSWGIAESSVYAALAKIKQTKAIKFRSHKVVIEWAVENSSRTETPITTSTHCQQGEFSRNLESILGSENQFSDPRIDSQILENDIYKDRARAADLLNFSNLQTGRVKNFEEEEPTNMPTALENQIEALDKSIDIGRGKSPAAPVEFCQQNVTVETAGGPVKFHQEDIKVETHGGQVEFHQEDIKVETHGDPVEFHQEDITVETHGGPVKFHQEDITVETHGGPVSFHQGNICVNDCPIGLERIPRVLLERIKALGIPLDEQIVGALKESHLSQVMGALNHIESTGAEIKSPRGVFLFQIKKMPIEQLGPRQPIVTAADFEVTDAVPPPASFKDMLAKLAEKKTMRR